MNVVLTHVTLCGPEVEVNPLHCILKDEIIIFSCLLDYHREKTAALRRAIQFPLNYVLRKVTIEVRRENQSD